MIVLCKEKITVKSTKVEIRCNMPESSKGYGSKAGFLMMNKTLKFIIICTSATLACMVKESLCHKVMRGSAGIALSTLNLEIKRQCVVSIMSQLFYPL
jgi:hypothetical protein